MADAVFVTLHTCTISSTFWSVARGSQFSRRSNSVLISNPYCTTAKSHWKETADKHLLVPTVASEKEGSLQQLAQNSQQKHQPDYAGRIFFQEKVAFKYVQCRHRDCCKYIIAEENESTISTERIVLGNTDLFLSPCTFLLCLGHVQVAEGIICDITELFLHCSLLHTVFPWSTSIP